MITKELPTEPGLYLWRKAGEDQWTNVIIKDDGELCLSFSDYYTVASSEMSGQWYRIPDPEEVCEWNFDGHLGGDRGCFYRGYRSSCGQIFDMGAGDDNYCRHCGKPKEIKE